MNSLIISPTIPPVPGRDAHGIYQRLGLFVRALSLISAQLKIAHIVPQAAISTENAAGLSDIQSRYWGREVSIELIGRRSRVETHWNHYCAGVVSAAHQPTLFPFGGREQASHVGRLLASKPDLVFVQQLTAMCSVIKSGLRPEAMFFDLDDLEHHALLRRALTAPARARQLAYLAQVPNLALMQRKAVSRACLTFVCSELDSGRLRTIGITRKIAVIPNAIVLPTALSRPWPGNTLLFLGACNYAPNTEAAERLARRIMPLVRRRVPNARLFIAGAGSKDLPSTRAEPPGIEYLGFVPDLKELYAQSKVICCPISQGGGTRIKLIEAAAYAKPIVSTPVGAEGLSLIDGREILLRSSDESFADACVQLLQNDDLCVRLGTAAREAVEFKHSAAKVAEKIAQLMCSSLR